MCTLLHFYEETIVLQTRGDFKCKDMRILLFFFGGGEQNRREIFLFHLVLLFLQDSAQPSSYRSTTVTGTTTVSSATSATVIWSVGVSLSPAPTSSAQTAAEHSSHFCSVNNTARNLKSLERWGQDFSSTLSDDEKCHHAPFARQKSLLNLLLLCVVPFLILNVFFGCEESSRKWSLRNLIVEHLFMCVIFFYLFVIFIFSRVWRHLLLVPAHVMQLA